MDPRFYSLEMCARMSFPRGWTPDNMLELLEHLFDLSNEENQ